MCAFIPQLEVEASKPQKGNICFGLFWLSSLRIHEQLGERGILLSSHKTTNPHATEHFVSFVGFHIPLNLEVMTGTRKVHQ